MIRSKKSGRILVFAVWGAYVPRKKLTVLRLWSRCHRHGYMVYKLP